MKNNHTEFDYSKLLGRIIEKFKSQRAFAEIVGLSEQSMSKKLTGKMTITIDDIKKWSSEELLDIPAADWHVYFFTPKVQEVEPIKKKEVEHAISKKSLCTTT